MTTWKWNVKRKTPPSTIDSQLVSISRYPELAAVSSNTFFNSGAWLLSRYTPAWRCSRAANGSEPGSCGSKDGLTPSSGNFHKECKPWDGVQTCTNNLKSKKNNKSHQPPLNFVDSWKIDPKKITETQQAKSRVIEVVLLSLQPPLDQQVPLGIVFFWCLRHGCVEAI